MHLTLSLNHPSKSNPFEGQFKFFGGPDFKLVYNSFVEIYLFKRNTIFKEISLLSIL
jgi:hypothetical protein